MSNNKDTVALHAHTMRQAPTDSEARLWRALRASQLGIAFRRQVPLLGFIADFYAPSARLICGCAPRLRMRAATASSRVPATASFGSKPNSSFRICRLPYSRCGVRSASPECGQRTGQSARLWMSLRDL